MSLTRREKKTADDFQTPWQFQRLCKLRRARRQLCRCQRDDPSFMNREQELADSTDHITSVIKKVDEIKEELKRSIKENTQFTASQLEALSHVDDEFGREVRLVARHDYVFSSEEMRELAEEEAFDKYLPEDPTDGEIATAILHSWCEAAQDYGMNLV